MPRHKRNRSSKQEPLKPSPRPKIRWLEPAALATICLVTFLAYLPAMHGEKLWDDDDNITRPEMQSTAGLWKIWSDPSSTAQYYPLLHTVFWLEHRLWGESYVGYHVMNVLWHCLAAVLLYLVLQRLKIPGGLLAVAIFALHPVMVESVAWMTEQKNTLSTVLYLGATFAYLEFDESRGRTHYFAALALFALALMTKTVVVTLPVALLIIFWWQRGTLSWQRDVLPLAPFFALSIASGLVTYWVERSYVHADAEPYDLTFVQRFLLAGRDVWFYLSTLVWPSNLTFTYPRWTIDPSQWWEWIYPIAAVLTTIGLWIIRKRSRAPLAAWLFFCGTLFPVLGFVNVFMFKYTYVADHLQYVASLGMIVLASAGITLGLARMSQPTRWAGIGFCICYVGALAALSSRQSAMYTDAVTLYKETIARNPECWMAHNNYGIKLAEAGNQAEAIEHYRLAISLKPESVDSHNNLGKALVLTGRIQEGIDEFHTTLAIKPDHFAALNNLGFALIQLQRYSDAIEPLENALRLNPNYADAHNKLGIARARTGHSSQAIEDFQAAIRLKPDSLEAYTNLSRALSVANEPEKAMAVARQAIKVARATGHSVEAEQIENLLRQYEDKVKNNRTGLPSAPR